MILGRRKSILILVGILVPVLIISSFLLFKTIDETEGIDVNNILIVSDKNAAIVGEMVNLTVKGCPDNSNITWSSDDNQTRYGKTAQFSFQTSAYHKINVTIKNGKDRLLKNITISIYNMNQKDEFPGFRIGFRPFNQGFQLDGTILEGINKPHIILEVKIPKCTAKVSFEILIFNNEESMFVHNSEATLVNEPLDNIITVQPTEWDLDSYPITVSSSMFLENGYLPDFHLTLSIVYS